MSHPGPLPPVEWANLVELLRWRAQHQTDRQAYTFLVDGDKAKVHLTYGELDQQARAIGAQLQALGAAGERILLLYPPGLAFVSAFLGCLYAGAVAVPLNPPRQNRAAPRLQAVLKDAQATFALTETTIGEDLERRLVHTPELATLQWVVTDTLADALAETWRPPEITSNNLAFLQYTSGSTGMPKGVMVSHSNLLHNLESLRQALNSGASSLSVSWLPHFHDMGLICSTLQPLYTGYRAVLMSPLAFLEQPVNWLRAISSYRATINGAPNFAYDLCVQKITPDQLETLELSCWRLAYNGAEPVRKETLERFITRFKPYGFRAEFFYPAYGLAEATLLVTSGSLTSKPVYYPVQAEPLARKQVAVASETHQEVKYLVGCGHPWLETKVVIADPERLTRCDPDEVGEIWVSGGSVAQGYWNKPQETAETFQAYLAETGEGPFLRTGDLGFIREGELFIAGRLKDLIIIRGYNHYPQDIELTVMHSHLALQPNAGAAFSVIVEGEERLVIAQEVARSHLRQLDVDAVIGAIQQAVAEQHELQPYAILLLKPGSIPKTSSGKLQRHACRAGFLEESLSLVGQWRQPAQASMPEEGKLIDSLLAAAPSERAELLRVNFQQQVASLLGISPVQVNFERPLTALGIDSLKAVELKDWLKNSLGLELPATKFISGLNLSSLMAELEPHLVQAAASLPAPASIQAESHLETPSQANPSVRAKDLLAKLDQLTDEEVEALLSSRLQAE